MAEEIKTQYLEFEIRYIENLDRWYAYDNNGEKVAEEVSLSALKDKLDKRVNRVKKAKFTPIEVFQIGNGFTKEHEIRFGKVTSITEERECWWTAADGQREKLYKSATLFVNNEKNEELIKQYVELQTKIKLLAQERDAISKQFERFVAPEL